MLTQKGRQLLNEFKAFAVKGSVVDMAAGVIIGTAFSKIVSSLVDDIVMPCISLLIGSVNIKSLSVTLKEAAGDESAIVLNYGSFLQAVLDFLLIAWCIFIALKLLFKLKHALSLEEALKPAAKVDPNVQLLTEIRDLLKEQNAAAQKTEQKAEA